jgi:hypothetical protein
MALSKHPAIATEPIMRTPEDNPKEKVSISKMFNIPKTSPMHPVATKILPVNVAALQPQNNHRRA